MAKDPNKTENATPRRIKKAREKGNVAKSQEASKTMSVLAGLIIVSFWIQFIAKDMMGIFRYFMINSPTFPVNDANLMQTAAWLSLEFAKMVLPVFLVCFACIYILLRIQVGKLWTKEPFKFKLMKFNIIAGLKRMFISPQTIIRLVRSLLQALCIGIAPYLVIKSEAPNFLLLYHTDAMGVAAYILETGARIVIYALMPMFVIAAFDIWYTRWKYREDLKMTKNEVKDERKMMMGDEAVRNRMKQKMLQMSAARMMQQVPKADVVITNPTHIAVALKYDPQEVPAPVVVAMGVDRIAEKIKEIARENGVPIKENKPLARALYKQTEVGDVIPAELFQAVAAVLAQIWKNKPRKTPL